MNETYQDLENINKRQSPLFHILGLLTYKISHLKDQSLLSQYDHLKELLIKEIDEEVNRYKGESGTI